MNSTSRTTRSGVLAAVIRGARHALILAALGLTFGLAGMTSPVVTAQVETTEPAGGIEDAATTADVGTAPPEVQQVPGDAQLHVGETASLENGALQVTMVQVVEDSRCPMDAMCVWMGRAMVGLHVVLDGVDRGDVNVTLYPGSQTQPSPDLDATVDRYVISLADLQPYPAASRPQPLDQRVATIRVAPATP